MAGGRAGTLSLLLTGDEEGPAINGTVKLLDWALRNGNRFDAAIVGEPTSPEGDRRHDQDRAARQPLGHDPRLRPAGPRRLSASRRQPGDRPDPAPRPADPSASSTRAAPISSRPTSKSPASTSAIRAFNVIPAEATARFNVRFNDRWSPASARRAGSGKNSTPQPTAAATSSTIEPGASESFLTRSDGAGRPAGGGDPRGDRPRAGAFDQRRHVGRPLLQGRLPGGRVRPRRRDHAPGRRARAGSPTSTGSPPIYRALSRPLLRRGRRRRCSTARRSAAR